MKIGIITFHWATNYGAVLQAYALQTYLSQLGYQANIINYIPYTSQKTLSRCFVTRRPWRIPYNLLDYLKELRLNKFRGKYLNLSNRYHSVEQLKKRPPTFDVYICGSDQVWNPTFTAKGEGKPTLSYFLDFGSDSVKRIAYAVSFGCTEYPENLLNFISPVLRKFDAISVRENSGCQIIHKIGIHDVSLMPDPTLLLQAKDYDRLLSTPKKTQSKHLFFYVLHSNQKTIEEMRVHFKSQQEYNISDARSFGHSVVGINRWLSLIKSAEAVVTNSFHGVVFSILFRRPFIAVPVEGSDAGMNDRIFTLLGKIGLEDHIMGCYDQNRINAVLTKKIDWPDIENKVDLLRKEAYMFFIKNLN